MGSIHLDARHPARTCYRSWHGEYLTAGSYSVSLVRGVFTAWTAWNDRHAWLNRFEIWSPAWSQPVRVNDDTHYRTQDEALAASQEMGFTIAANALVVFFIRDSLEDNDGGLSLSLSPH